MYEEDTRSNVIIVPTETESIDDIVNFYAERALECRSLDDFRLLFQMCFDEALYYTEKQYAIDLALGMVERIKEMHIEDNFE